MHNAVRNAVSRLLDTGLADEDSIQGCTSAEIERIESELGVELPPCYKDFLLAMGRSAGEFMVGTDYSIDKLPKFRTWAEHCMASNKVTFRLPQAAVVFASHQGYSFLYFDADGGLDPPVLMYTEAQPGLTQIATSFSEWLKMAVEDDIEACGGKA